MIFTADILLHFVDVLITGTAYRSFFFAWSNCFVQSSLSLVPCSIDDSIAAFFYCVSCAMCATRSLIVFQSA